MKSLSTELATQELKAKLRSDQCYSYTKVTYIDDNGNEVIFSDHAYPMKIKKIAEPPRYANINYDPAAAVVEFIVINEEGQYSPKNTTSLKSGILVRDRIFKFYDGKKINSLPDPTTEVLADSEAELYFMAQSGADIVPDLENNEGNVRRFFDDLFDDLDEEIFDDIIVSPAGYAIYNREFHPRVDITNITIVANSTNGLVFYRTGSSTLDIEALGNTSDKWTYAGTTINGTKSFTVSLTNRQALQIAVVNNSSSWLSSDFTLTSVTITFQDKVEWVLLGSFYLDDPVTEDPSGVRLSEVSVNGRNAWKKALEYKMNIEALSNKPITELIQDIADEVGISYTASSIADLSGFSNRTLSSDGYKDQISAAEIFRDIMQIIGKDYRMFLDDNNILFVQPRPLNKLSELVYHLKHYVSAKQFFVGEKQLQRLTIFTDQQVLDETINLGSPTVFNTAGVQTAITWSNKAIAKHWRITASTGTLAIVLVVFTNTSATFTTSGSGTLTVQVRGNEFRSTEPTYVGEAANAINLQNKNGFTFQIENPLMISDAECKSRAEDFIDDYGTPEYNISVVQAFLDPLIEINDPTLFISEKFFEDGIYAVKGITYNLNSEVDKFTEIDLIDTGQRISDTGGITYDRDDLSTDKLPITADAGYPYDIRYGPGSTVDDLDETLYRSNLSYV